MSQENQDQSQELSILAGRKEYQPPKLIHYGSIHEITQGSGGPLFDASLTPSISGGT